MSFKNKTHLCSRRVADSAAQCRQIAPEYFGCVFINDFLQILNHEFTQKNRPEDIWSVFISNELWERKFVRLGEIRG
jgi:hypothetical protein